MRGLDGKVAVVTGGGHGIGRASALRLAEEGAHVVIVDTDGEAARQGAASLPTESIGTAGDIASEADTDSYIQLAVGRFGRIDLHHLNAGISGSFARLPDLTAADFDAVMSVNLRGTFLGLRAAFRQYDAQHSGGAVCITASIASLRGSADLLPYQTSKHGVLGLLHGAAMYGGPLGIRVNAVAPGHITTPMVLSVSAPGARPEVMNTMRSQAGLRGAPGTGWDVGWAATFLASDEARWITGVTLPVESGVLSVTPLMMAPYLRAVPDPGA